MTNFHIFCNRLLSFYSALFLYQNIIKTYYEQQWLDRGLNIKYIKFHLPKEGELHEPDVEIELDEYRSYNRSKRSGLQTSK